MNIYPVSHANIIELLGIQKLPLDERQEIIETAVELVDTRMAARLAKVLGEEGIKVLDEARERGDAEAFQEYCVSHQIDVESMLMEEMAGIKKELLEVADQKDRPELA